MRTLVAAVAAVLLSSSAAAAIPASQRDALVSLYNATGGPGWRDRTNWLGAPGSECTWFGVSCDTGSTTVVELTLHENNLVGTIPDSIGGFPDLRTLLLYDNKLRGSIPSAIGQLVKMDTMILDRNELTGTIPASIGNLTAMTLFNADGNLLTGPLPRELGNLRSLEELDLSYNAITGALPAELGQLSNLRVLDLNVNALSGTIPAALANLSKLERLGLFINALTGTIPPELGSLRALTSLILDANRLEGPIPPSLGNLTNLDDLNLGRNMLTGSIPRELGNLAQLRLLTLQTNLLTGTIPADFFRLTNLEFVNIGDNKLTGAIPREFGTLTKLQQLSLHTNGFTGSIATELGSLTALTALELQNNDLTGPFPRELGRLVNLELIDIAQNRLSGPLPVEVGALKKMQFFSLYENEFSGPIPPELGGLPDLVILYLTSNRFTGTIPDSLRRLTKLERLYLAGNELTGDFPQWIGELPLLVDLRLEENELTGVIPASIGNLVNLEQLFIDYNRIEGALPREIGNLKKLQYLSAEFNDISGPIPPELWQLTELLQIRLTRLRLTGTLPPAVGNLKKLEALLLNGNDLEGAVPREIGDLPNLLYLDLTSNLFSGPIPPEIGKLTKLINLSLGGNQFRGEVPKALMSLTALDRNGSDLGLNALFTSDQALRAFINTKQFDEDFERTQTVTPRDVRVSSVTDRSAVVEWSLIRYIEGRGGYQVVVSKTPDGPPVVIATTASKEISSLLVRGLDPSTPYFFRVSAVSHPNDYQKSVLVSDSSAAVPATTTQRVMAPADVDVSEQPNGLVQVDGVPANEDSFTLTNYGDVATSISFFKDGDYFTFEPATFTLGPGASQVVRLRSLPKPPGTYYGGVDPEGDGVPGDLFITVTLLSVAKPTGTVIAEAIATRVDVAGVAGSDSVGQVRFRNRGTARLSGLLISDEPFVVPDPEPITIDPGQTATANFRVIRARRPANEQDGALTANLMLVYVDGSVAPNLLRGGGLLLTLLATPGVNVTLVTVVDQPKLPVTPSLPPQLSAGDIALFVPGVVSALKSFGRVVSDVSILNIGTARSVNDLRVFFTPTGSAQSSAATLNGVDASKAVTLANVPNIYGTESGTGSLQIRSAAAQSLSVLGKLVTISAAGTLLGDVPVFRSDRAVAAGQAVVLTGVRKSSSLQTDLYLQETAGQPFTARVDFLDATGAAAQPSRSIDVGAFGSSELVDSVVQSTITVVVTNTGGSGRLTAYGRITDNTSGETWSIVDWSRFNRFRTTDSVRIPYAEAASGGTTGRRRAASHATGAAATELTLFNPGTEDVRVAVDVIDREGRASSRDVTIGARQTSVLALAAPAAQAVVTPGRGQVVVTARTFRPAASSLGSNVPVVDAKSGLRIGQSQRFSNLDDSTAATVAAAKPGTYRTAFGFVESSGLAVTVRARIVLDQGRLASAVLARDFALAPNEQLLFDNMVRAIIGDSRETSLGELHNLQLSVEVIEGRGSVVPFVIVTDNGSLDTLLRLE
jgi:Leucine-rich repeat (LRR) protein